LPFWFPPIIYLGIARQRRRDLMQVSMRHTQRRCETDPELTRVLETAINTSAAAGAGDIKLRYASVKNPPIIVSWQQGARPDAFDRHSGRSQSTDWKAPVGSNSAQTKIHSRATQPHSPPAPLAQA
jgi:hypothetical protein